MKVNAHQSSAARRPTTSDTGEVADQLEGIDAFGVGVFNTAEGKRLYFGKAGFQPNQLTKQLQRW